MICKDCGIEKDTATKRRDGVIRCKECAARMSNCKYHGREYIPKINETNTSKKKGIPRIKHSKSELNKTSVETANVNNEQILTNMDEISKLVDKEIQSEYKKRNINLMSGIMFQQLFVLLDACLSNVKFIDDYYKAEQVFNKLQVDYNHAIEDSKTDESFLKFSKMLKVLLEKRRDIKDVIISYEQGGNFFSELKKDEEFMKKFTDAFTKQMQLDKVYNKDNYKVNISNEVLKEDFAVGKKRDYVKRHWKVTVNSIERNVKPFIRDTFALSSSEAIDNVLKFIQGSEYKISYRRKDIEVIELDSMGNPLESKECL